MTNELYIEAGKIANTHGIGGDAVVDSYCDAPEVLKALRSLYIKSGSEYKKLIIKKASLFKGRVLFHFEGYDSIEAAIPLKNRLLYAEREEFCLDEGEYFIVDLIGLSVYDVDSGECYGKVTDVLNYGASDIYEIEKPDKKKAYVPVVPEFVKKVDLESGIYLSVIEGLI
ncbi:MAG: 16S rRNA processing protein RimM [Clostridia bacterium]|nr:16S rRNA processing protein RimM [Clostridia bacterium]